jgi:hypothetical protein
MTCVKATLVLPSTVPLLPLHLDSLTGVFLTISKTAPGEWLYYFISSASRNLFPTSYL